MRGESEFAEKVRRPGADLLRGDTIKVVNMLDLARELSGEPAASYSPETHPDPSEFWKRAFLDWRGATPLVVTVPPAQVVARKPAVQSFTFNETATEELRTFADQVGIP